MPEIGLAIGHESGTYREWQRDWLYWYKKDRTRLLTAEERAKAEALRANVAEQRAQVAFSDGEQQGIQTGEQNKTFEIARNMLAKGLEPALVADTTGLSMDELATLIEIGK